ncbi:cytochrome P450 [Xylaria scruposa]|nr:cytochrome P450 [Xylaria scruposa]
MVLSYLILPAIILALVGVRVVLNWDKLRKAPGPILAGFTDLWRAYHQNNGTLREKLLELHAKHGSIVRYGVKCISISDPEVINVVYGSRAGFITAESYKVLMGHQNGKDIPSLVSTRNEKQHGALRRSVANAFTPTAALDYEKWIDVTIEELLESVARRPEFDLASTALWYTMDASARFSFGAPLGCLTAEGDVGGSIQLIRDRLSHWARWASYPRIERLVHRNPIFKPPTRGPSSMVAAATGKLNARKNDIGVSKEGKEADVAPDLLDRFLEASKDFPQALDGPGIVGMLMSTISGAGDTTASTIAAMLFYLMKNPETLKKLENELTAAGIQGVPAFAEVSKLPYLNAVLRESMRVFTPLSFPMERLVPAGGAVIAGMYFPEGTSVGCMPAAIHLNKGVFGDDVDEFRPERWLIEDREQLRLMEAAHMGFSRGRRNCLGQNIAVLSMKKVVPALIMKFKFDLVDSNASLKADYATAAAVVEPIYVTSKVKTDASVSSTDSKGNC